MYSNNNLQRAIREKVVEPMLKERVHSVKGLIIDHDNETNTAVIEIPNPTGHGKQIIAGVPIQITGGFHAAGPFKGDHVWVGFMGGNISRPKVLSVADEFYQQKTRRKQRHERQGSMVPDSYTR